MFGFSVHRLRRNSVNFLFVLTSFLCPCSAVAGMWGSSATCQLARDLSDTTCTGPLTVRMSDSGCHMADTPLSRCL